MKNILYSFSFLATATFSQAKEIKVACVGDSITFGAGVENRAQNNYPAQLQRLLGDGYKVKNFGVNGRTMLSQGNLPWIKHPNYKRAATFAPDVVVIKLGTNDSKPINWKHKAEFVPNAQELANYFKNLPSKPRVIFCTPVPALTGPAKVARNIPGTTIKDEVVPLVREAAAKSNSELIDLYTEFSNFGRNLGKFMPDKVHPNAEGAAHLALRVADQILLPRNADFSIEKKLSDAGAKVSKGNFHDYTKYSFQLASADNAGCVIVAPKHPIKGQPWIWRARFFGHQPALDKALLDRGFHVCYCDIANLFGSPSAVQRWNKFYDFTQTLGLSKKPVLEGMSRGGLIITNWAKANPNKVAAIYGDNPVCDIRSWPAKKSPNDWKRCLSAWKKTAADMPNFKGNPIDGLEPLAKANVPIFLVLGTKDKVVPLAENAHILADRYTKFGGSVVIWEKPNGRHHPHGLHPVFPLLRYILHATGNPISPTLYQRASTQTFPKVSTEVKKKRQDTLKNSKRILFLGDSITFGGDYVTDFTTWVEQQPFAPSASFVNIGVPSETVSGLSEKGHARGKFPRPDLHERLTRVLENYKPDLIFSCYGMNCGIYKPLDEKRFNAYKEGYKKLNRAAEKIGAKIIFITPPMFDDHGKSTNFNYATVLNQYSHWLDSQRAQGWEVIDQNTEMTAAITGGKVLNPAHTLQPDRIHPNAKGHRVMAQSLINYYSSNLTTHELIKQNVINKKRRNLTHQRMITLRDAWLKKTKHLRPGIAGAPGNNKGLPLDQAEAKAIEITKKINSVKP